MSEYFRRRDVRVAKNKKIDRSINIKSYPSTRCMFNVEGAQQMFSQRLPGSSGLVPCLQDQMDESSRRRR